MCMIVIGIVMGVVSYGPDQPSEVSKVRGSGGIWQERPNPEIKRGVVWVSSLLCLQLGLLHKATVSLTACVCFRMGEGLKAAPAACWEQKVESDKAFMSISKTPKKVTKRISKVARLSEKFVKSLDLSRKLPSWQHCVGSIGWQGTAQVPISHKSPKMEGKPLFCNVS